MKTINPVNLRRLKNAFTHYLVEQGVPFYEIGLVEEEEQLVLVFVRTEKAHVFKFGKNECLGHEPDFIAKSVIDPMLEHIKGIDYDIS